MPVFLVLSVYAHAAHVCCPGMLLGGVWEFGMRRILCLSRWCFPSQSLVKCTSDNLSILQLAIPNILLSFKLHFFILKDVTNLQNWDVPCGLVELGSTWHLS